MMLAKRIGVETTTSSLTTKGCEKAFTSRHDLIWVNFPHIDQLSCGACRLLRRGQNGS